MESTPSLLWARVDGTVYRVWITHTVLPGAGGDFESHAIHFADPAWNAVGSAPVEAALKLTEIDESELEGLLERAMRRS